MGGAPEKETPPVPAKNAAAVALGKLGGKKRGLAPSFSAMTCAAVVAAMLSQTCWSATDPTQALRVVRVGHGNAAAMHDDIQVTVDACRLAKHMPPSAAKLPSDAVLSQMKVVEQEELFDGQKWAEFSTQRTIAADPSNGCTLAVFVHRDASAEKTCVSRVSGATTSLGEMTDPKAPAASVAKIDETALPAQPCAEHQKPLDLAGLPREDAGGGAQCVWNSAIAARKMAAIYTLMHKVPPPPKPDASGHDICLDADRPSVDFEGFRRVVVLATRTTPRKDGPNIENIIGETAAFGNLRLESLTASPSLPADRFSRSAVEQFLHLPSKTALGTGS